MASKVQSSIHKFPRSIHPLVFKQPETGRKVLNLSPWFAPVSLDPNVVEVHNKFLLWNFAGGIYQLDYGLRRRANAPVADP